MLTPVTQKFVLHWGEMGTRWGINRTVAQIHALLFLSSRPLHAEEIATSLGVARSNVSNSIKELQGWGIIRTVHVMGDRRDHFESLKDVFEMFQIILDERRKREVDPTITILRECASAARDSGKAEEFAARRIGDMLEFFETMTGWYDQLRRLPTSAVTKFVRMGSKIPKWLGLSA
ncbi:MAG: hypothetical protein AMXMBFR47_18620 [Planctomycetota bacterium]